MGLDQYPFSRRAPGFGGRVPGSQQGSHLGAATIGSTTWVGNRVAETPVWQGEAFLSAVRVAPLGGAGRPGIAPRGAGQACRRPWGADGAITGSLGLL